MRTKVLIGAAALAAGALTSMAQVYSLNVVGYVNIPVMDGFNLIANPLDLDGTGVNNWASSVFSNSLPVNSKVYSWSGTAYNIATYGKTKTWGNDIQLNPGLGFWLSIPSATFGTGVTGSVTTVGTVLQGSLVNHNLAAAGGFAIVSSIAPVQGALQTALNYSPTANDKIYFWNGTGYDIYTYGKTKIWGPSEPTVQVGQGFWLSSAAASTWSNYFIVQ